MASSDIRDGIYENVDEGFSIGLQEVDNFAQWAFGPDGLPALEILAYGDFSFQGRRPNILFCRSLDILMDGQSDTSSPIPSTTPFRVMTAREAKSCDLVQDNLDFLEACPEDILLHQVPEPW